VIHNSGVNKKKLAEEDILRLINEKYLNEENNRDVSVIYKGSEVFDHPKKAVYGIK
jgi:hypothetical protein